MNMRGKKGLFEAYVSCNQYFPAYSPQRITRGIHSCGFSILTGHDMGGATWVESMPGPKKYVGECPF